MRPKGVVIAIDGPAGSGKSTVAQKLAKRLGYLHIDTGAIYRSLAFWALERQLPLEDGEAIARLASELSFEYDEAGLKVGGVRLGQALRHERVAEVAARLACYPQVREILLQVQRDLGAEGGVVLEGRDIGTVVFPDAELKVFLTASEEERALRRWREEKARGFDSSLEEVRASIRRRDEQDARREVAPLRVAQDALQIDTTGREVEGIVAEIEGAVRKKLKG
ncbi:MAG: (d)CMP kinase [Sandaracinaceae bacterium]|nr:(d)CMP kinase [Sandaracinaceae bacterium]MDW8245347.1 (d)CMP kinase [Sandaracinaceae bacterium]